MMVVGSLVPAGNAAASCCWPTTASGLARNCSLGDCPTDRLRPPSPRMTSAATDAEGDHDGPAGDRLADAAPDAGVAGVLRAHVRDERPEQAATEEHHRRRQDEQRVARGR